jgi:hypothetical protein
MLFAFDWLVIWHFSVIYAFFPVWLFASLLKARQAA